MTTSSAADTASTPLESRYGEWVATFAPASGPIEVSARGLPPEQSSRNGHTVVFDGLLQNAEDLRAQLMPAAAEAGSNADLVALAYGRWGPDVPDRLRGTWLLAVWDEKRRELLCARDPLGLYPAYYAERDGALLLSPSVEALAGDGRVSSAVNRAALADHLCHRWPMLEETYYEAVKRLPGGYRLTVGADGKTLERYWDLPEQDERLVGGAGDEEQERFDELLEQAVARCLPGPTGIYLSGGLDSVSVAALATELADRSGLPRPYALSLVFEHETCNEESVQRDVARRLGLEQTILPVRGALGGRSLLESALEMSAERPAPMLNLWSPAYRYLALDARRRGREVILTGNGGDEWLEFPVKFAATLIRRGDILRLYRIWQSMQRSYPLSKSRVAWNLLWTFGTRPLLGSGGRAFLQGVAPGVLRARRRRFLDRQTRGWIAPDAALRAQLYERQERALQPRETSLDSPIIALELEEFFESGRQVGLRLLHPLWDPDLAAFLARTPIEVRILGGRSKALVRRSLARRFPGLGFEGHRKITGTDFYRSLLAEEGRQAWRRLGGARALAELEVVDRESLERNMDELLARANPTDHYVLWHVMSVEAWLRGRLGISLHPSNE